MGEIRIDAIPVERVYYSIVFFIYYIYYYIKVIPIIYIYYYISLTFTTLSKLLLQLEKTERSEVHSITSTQRNLERSDNERSE